MTAALLGPRGLRHKPLLLSGALLGVALLCWRFPLFRVVPLESARERSQRQAVAFDAAKVAAAFFAEKLLPATDHASDAKEVLAALAKDATAARKQYGRTFGLSSTTLFFVRGTGHVTAVGANAVALTLDGTDTKVSLATGMLFGDAVRDATGLLDINSYPNSQDFNDIAAQLNSLVENQVVPPLRHMAAVGKALRFAGCFELEENARPEVWSVIPVRIEWL